MTIRVELIKRPKKLDDFVVDAARVSFGKGAKEYTKEQNSKLIHFLAAHEHWSPFAHPRMTFPLVWERDMSILRATPTDIAGMVWSSSRSRHSLYGWANFVNKGLLPEDKTAMVVGKMKESAPVSTSALIRPSVLGNALDRYENMLKDHSEWEGGGIELNPRFIDTTFRYTVPIAIARQEFKHIVGFARNEVSRRYVYSDPEVHKPTQWRSRPTGSMKQGSGEVIEASEAVQLIYTSATDHALRAYEDLLKADAAPEQARMVLPQGMHVEYYVTANLYSYKRFYNQRIEVSAQKEIQELAKEVDEILSQNHRLWKYIKEY